MKRLLFVLAVTFLFACESKKSSTDNSVESMPVLNCDSLPKSFATFDEAVDKIRKTNFLVKEEANTASSSWIRGASFFSCNKQTGYFILITDKQDFFYGSLPYFIWTNFKNAKSLGTYYNLYIKDRYELSLVNKKQVQ